VFLAVLTREVKMRAEWEVSTQAGAAEIDVLGSVRTVEDPWRI
jgi:hypothetical protein